VFTGITQGTFLVIRTHREPGLLRYAVELPGELLKGLTVGASVAIDGVCQTVVEIQHHSVVFEAIDETLRCTTLEALTPDTRVSVERSVRVGDEIGGHDVAGHVIGTGEILNASRVGGSCDLRIGVPGAWMKHIFPKGFIAVDGSSLTVGKVSGSEPPSSRGWLDVHLIPETLRLTNLGEKGIGARVNIELDARTVAIVQTVERVLAQRGLLGQE
jgi:riboflavin synthase